MVTLNSDGVPEDLKADAEQFQKLCNDIMHIVHTMLDMHPGSDFMAVMVQEKPGSKAGALINVIPPKNVPGGLVMAEAARAAALYEAKHNGLTEQDIERWVTFGSKLGAARKESRG